MLEIMPTPHIGITYTCEVGSARSSVLKPRCRSACEVRPDDMLQNLRDAAQHVVTGFVDAHVQMMLSHHLHYHPER